MMRGPVRGALGILSAALFVIACSGAQPSVGDRQSGREGTSGPARQKTITVAISNAVDSFSIMGSSTTSGGWQSLNELHSQGLVTADREIQRPVARVASRVPSFDNGGLELLPDGRMRSTYELRTDVTWQDGTPFSARDMSFAFELNADRAMPFLNRDAIQEMVGVETPDDRTLSILWRGPYYQADSIGLRALWPHPRHILEPAYRGLDRLAFINLPYWTAEYLHLGPFRVVEFQPGENLVFQAYEGYFLGRPKVDRIVVRVFNDEPVLFSAVLADSVDVLMDNSLGGDLGLDLKDAWDRSGKGVVHVGTGTTRFISPQFDPDVLQQPAALDPRVRQALTFAVDRAALSEVVQHGHAELVASSLLPPGDRAYEGVRDGFARYTFDQSRARGLLAQAGWQMGSDGVLVGAEGRRFTTLLWTTEGSEREIAVIADYWKGVGVQAELYVVGGAIVRDREARSRYPGFETSARGSGDSILSRVDSRVSAVAGNNYSGANRGHYANPRMDVLIDRYRQSVTERDLLAAAGSISELMAEDLPLMLLYFNPTTPAVRTGVRALDDFRGGAESSRLFGTFSRNAHEWDVQ